MCRRFFGKDGLNLNIMRYNIGGGDDPTHRHITRTDSAMPGWMNENGVYDYTADRNQLNVLTRAVEAAGAEAKVELFSNSTLLYDGERLRFGKHGRQKI